MIISKFSLNFFSQIFEFLIVIIIFRDRSQKGIFNQPTLSVEEFNNGINWISLGNNFFVDIGLILIRDDLTNLSTFFTDGFALFIIGNNLTNVMSRSSLPKISRHQLFEQL